MPKPNRISAFFCKADDRLYAAEVIFGVALALVMVIAVFLQVFFRYIINNGFSVAFHFSPSGQRREDLKESLTTELSYNIERLNCY